MAFEFGIRNSQFERSIATMNPNTDNKRNSLLLRQPNLETIHFDRSVEIPH